MSEINYCDAIMLTYPFIFLWIILVIRLIDFGLMLRFGKRIRQKKENAPIPTASLWIFALAMSFSVRPPKFWISLKKTPEDLKSMARIHNGLWIATLVGIVLMVVV